MYKITEDKKHMKIFNKNIIIVIIKLAVMLFWWFYIWWFYIGKEQVRNVDAQVIMSASVEENEINHCVKILKDNGYLPNIEKNIKEYIDTKLQEQFGVENCQKLREKLNGDWWCDYPYN